MLLTFDDVLIKPQFSDINSRKEVDLSTDKFLFDMKLPVFSSNMDTITEHNMCAAMRESGGIGVYHRFWDIQENVQQFSLTRAGYKCGVSFGLGEQELIRAEKLYNAGAKVFFLDVAHGAQAQVARQYHVFKHMFGDDVFIVVGNFATSDSVMEFCRSLGYTPDAIKVGIGPGSVCTTRIKTGCGVSQLSAIQDCASYMYNMTEIPIIADGGIRTPGDVAKALAAGADAVMLGGMLAGTEETPGKVVGPSGYDWHLGTHGAHEKYKMYRGSASKESYKDQGKSSGWRTAEGESTLIPYKGSVKAIMKDIEGGLRSAFTYVGARNVQEFKEKAKLQKITAATQKENGAHGKV